MQGVSIEKLEELYATAMDYGITLVTISHEPGAKNGSFFQVFPMFVPSLSW